MLASGSPQSTWHSVQPKRATSTTAACITGQVRGGVFAPVTDLIQRNIFKPLGLVDSFVVLSQDWSRTASQVIYYQELSVLDLEMYATVWEPRAAVLTRDDDELLRWVEAGHGSVHAGHAQLDSDIAASSAWISGTTRNSACAGWPLQNASVCMGSSRLWGVVMQVLRMRVCLALIHALLVAAAHNLNHTETAVDKRKPDTQNQVSFFCYCACNILQLACSAGLTKPFCNLHGGFFSL